MATKKQTTKAKTTGQRQDSAAEIAAHISAILNHPATPVCVYNSLADAVCELDAPTSFWDSAEYITLALHNNVRREGRAGD
jgi:hypothetical protein